MESLFRWKITSAMYNSIDNCNHRMCKVCRRYWNHWQPQCVRYIPREWIDQFRSNNSIACQYHWYPCGAKQYTIDVFWGRLCTFQRRRGDREGTKWVGTFQG